MKSPLFSHLAKRKAAAPAIFDFPAFFGARNGVVYVGAPRYSNAYFDSAGTTPATNSYEAMGRGQDLSGNGNHFLQTASINKPVVNKYGPTVSTAPLTTKSFKHIVSGGSNFGPSAFLESAWQNSNSCTVIGLMSTVGTNNLLWKAGSIDVGPDYVGSTNMARLWGVSPEPYITGVAYSGYPNFKIGMIDVEFADVGGGNTDITLRASGDLTSGLVGPTTFTTATTITPGNLKTSLGTGFTSIPFLFAIDGQLSAGERTTLYNLINSLFTGAPFE